MSYKITKKEKNNLEVEITISAEEWERALEERRKSHEASLERLGMLYKQSN